MDRIVADLQVWEFYGLLALALFMFYAAGMLLRYEPSDAPRIGFLVAAFVIAAPPIYIGLRVFFPSLPDF